MEIKRGTTEVEELVTGGGGVVVRGKRRVAVWISGEGGGGDVSMMHMWPKFVNIVHKEKILVKFYNNQHEKTWCLKVKTGINSDFKHHPQMSTSLYSMKVFLFQCIERLHCKPK